MVISASLSELSAHRRGEAVAIFCHRSQSFLRLGSAGDWMIEALLNQRPASAVIDDMHRATGIARATIERDLQGLLARLRAGGEPGAARQTDNRHLFASAALSPPPGYALRWAQIGGHRVWLALAPAALAAGLAEHPLLAPLDAAGAAPPGVDVLLHHREGRWQIEQAGAAPAAGHAALDSAALMLRAALESRAAFALAELAVLHAGAVADDRHCIVLTAIGGSGKSTLTAGLCRHGYALLHDDVLPLDAAMQVRSLGELIKLKRGSWSLIDELAPCWLEPQPLPVGASALRCARAPTAAGPRCATHLVVPRYAPGEAAAQRALNPVEALHALVAAESIFRKPLPSAAIDRLLNWLAGVSCHRISYPDLDTAIAQVRALCGPRQ